MSAMAGLLRHCPRTLLLFEVVETLAGNSNHTMPTVDSQADPLFQRLVDLQVNIERAFFGKRETVQHLLVGLLSQGHVLIEDVPGVGKTVLARTMAKSIDCRFSRVQLTPDLLPSDILGVNVYDSNTSTFEFHPGPIFANVVLADEINRTTPRTQSALLEAMNECQVSTDGVSRKIDKPFIVIATQNPFEYEGTFPLPENQLDRFCLRIRIGYPSRRIEQRILREQPDRHELQELTSVMHADEVLALQERVTRVRVDDRLIDYTVDLAQATRDHNLLQVGVSPRGSLSLIRAAQALALLQGHTYVVPDDVKMLTVPVFAHRVVSKSYMHNGNVVTNDAIIADIVKRIPVPS